ncbi:MAG: DUF3995 domain-containing protein [Saprospiraceae bacterium]|jgi:hypothetical protein|nr:DUF3995 domain-containing protein [Saprospiraceae bacterium]
MVILISLLLFAIFLALSAIHVYWLLGGKWGLAASVPTHAEGQPLFRPGPVAMLVVAGGLLLMGLAMLVRGGLIQIDWLPDRVGEWSVWAIAAIFLLRAMGDFRYVGFFKKEKGSLFARMDTKYFSPLCLLIGCLALLLLLIA